MNKKKERKEKRKNKRKVWNTSFIRVVPDNPKGRFTSGYGVFTEDK